MNLKKGDILVNIQEKISDSDFYNFDVIVQRNFRLFLGFDYKFISKTFTLKKSYKIKNIEFQNQFPFQNKYIRISLGKFYYVLIKYEIINKYFELDKSFERMKKLKKLKRYEN